LFVITLRNMVICTSYIQVSLNIQFWLPYEMWLYIICNDWDIATMLLWLPFEMRLYTVNVCQGKR